MISVEEIRLAQEGLQMALDAGAQKARITLDKSLMDLVATLDGEVDRVTHNLDRSMTISLFVDGRYGTFSTNRLERGDLRGFITRAVDTVRVLAEDPCRDLPSPERTVKGAGSGDELGLCDPARQDITPGRRKAMALELALTGKDFPADGWELISEEGEYSDSEYDTLVVDTNGLMCRHKETAFEYGVEVTIRDREGNKYSGYWWESAPLLRDFHPEDSGLKSLGKAAAQIGSSPVPGGRYTMVVDADVASKLVTPLLNALGGFSIQQDNSFLKGTLGTKVFSEGLTVTDHCHIAGEAGSRLFDTEGVATTEHDIITAGVVDEYFLNTYMAAKTGMQPTIEDATRPEVRPWPEAGLDRDAIMRRCGRGILVTGFNGGNSSPVTGDFSYGIEGFLFEDGKPVKPVSGMLATGNFLTLWQHLLYAGDDARRCMDRLIPTLAFESVDFSG